MRILKSRLPVLLGSLLLIGSPLQALHALELSPTVNMAAAVNRNTALTIKGLYLGMSIKEAEHLVKHKLGLDLRASEEGNYYFVQKGSTLLGSSSSLRSRSTPSDLILKTDPKRLVVEIILSGPFVKSLFQVAKETPIATFAQQFADEHFLKPLERYEQGLSTVWYEYDHPNKFTLKIDESFRILLVNKSGKPK